MNLLASLGVPLQSELCVWNMLGLLTTIFDATLFKVNANLKEVWAMEMPSELSMSVQRSLRTIISGIMLVQCFTVYVYLASYIVMLYPIYLEERPALLLPWLLLAAVRKLLCELISLALGLGTCVLVGPARTACIKFVIKKFLTLLPSFYMWMLVFSYYSKLKLSNAFIKLPIVRPSGSDQDGLELAVRRRCTKSLFDERQLRIKMLQNLASSNSMSNNRSDVNFKSKNIYSVNYAHNASSDTSVIDRNDLTLHLSVASNTEYMEDWFGSEIAMPRDADRVVAQFNLMLLRIAVFINSGESDTQKFLLSQAKLFFDAECLNHVAKDESLSRATKMPKKVARITDAPIVKSDEAIVSMPIRTVSRDHLLESDNEDRNAILNDKLSTNEIFKDNISTKKRWDRKRKAKSIKLNNLIRAKRYKHSHKVKVSQSILNLIDQCHKEVQERLKVKKDVDYKTHVEIDVSKVKMSTSRELKQVDQSTNMIQITHDTANKTTSTSKLKSRDSQTHKEEKLELENLISNNNKIEENNRTDNSSISASENSGSKKAKLLEIKLCDKEEEENKPRQSEEIKSKKHRKAMKLSSEVKMQNSSENVSQNSENDRTIQNITTPENLNTEQFESELNENIEDDKVAKSQHNACNSSRKESVDNLEKNVNKNSDKERSLQLSLQDKNTHKDSSENSSTISKKNDSQGKPDENNEGSK